MDDIMIIEYLKRKGMYNLSDAEFDRKFKEVMYQHYMKDFKDIKPEMPESMPESKPEIDDTKHLSEAEAKEVVANMYHYSCGNKYSGEVFSMGKAQEVYNSYRNCMYGNVPVTDVYVAINAQYHDYIDLFKDWFGDSLEPKIIESAIVFWFRDDDYCTGSKVYNYFHKW